MLSRFHPDAERGRSVDRAVRFNLQRSLRALYDRVTTILVFDEGRLNALLDDLVQGPVRPAVFGTYTDLVESLLAGDFDVAQRVSDQLLALPAPCAETRIVTLTSEDLGPDQPARYARLIDDDPEQPIHLKPVADKPAAVSAVTDALSLISACAPELAGEIHALVHEIVTVEPAISPETGELSAFDGASTLYLWGAVTARLGSQSRVDLAQTLAHESGHLLLFGLTQGQPLVENAYDERYESPLRSDARPMEGLVHAAYVVARMHYAVASMLGSGKLRPEEQQNAREWLAQHEISFRNTLPTIERHARFTKTGAAIFRDAVDYMGADRSVTLAVTT